MTLKKQFKKEEALSNSTWAPEKVRGLIASLNKKLENKILNDIQKDIENLSKTNDSEISLKEQSIICLLYTSPSPRDKRQSRMPSSA